MNLKQLKRMISEEYRYWLAEQPIDGTEGPGMPGMPGIEVGPGDIDAMGGGGDSEATLRQIYDMLKDYFEGGGAEGAAAPGAPAGDDMDMDMDMDAGDDMDDAEEEEDVSEDKEDDKEDKKEGKKDKEELKERFQKLANILKG